MASKSTKDESKTEEPVITASGRTAFPHESDPKLAAEATGIVQPVDPEDAEPGQPVVDPNPAYDPAAPENQPESESKADKDDDKK